MHIYTCILYFRVLNSIFVSSYHVSQCCISVRFISWKKWLGSEAGPSGARVDVLCRRLVALPTFYDNPSQGHITHIVSAFCSAISDIAEQFSWLFCVSLLVFFYYCYYCFITLWVLLPPLIKPFGYNVLLIGFIVFTCFAFDKQA